MQYNNERMFLKASVKYSGDFDVTTPINKIAVNTLHKTTCKSISANFDIEILS